MVNWQDYAPEINKSARESTEWSISYSFNAVGSNLPRVLLIGDSICNGYSEKVRALLDKNVNVSFWASSKCLTAPGYFRELDMILDSYMYDMICFNNGLHSLSTNRDDWETAYRAAVDFIQAKIPAARLSLTLCTPLTDENKTAISASLNRTALALAEEKGLPVIDLFSEMDRLDREKYWRDVYHFHDPAIVIQANIIAGHVLEQLGIK